MSQRQLAIITTGLGDQPSDSNQSSGGDLHSPYYSQCDEVLEAEIVED